MIITILKLLCPIILVISIIYPTYRGWIGVGWKKSILLGWAFFVSGCLFREHITPFLAKLIGGTQMREQVQCASSILLWGIALGWIIPIIFHGLGVGASKMIDKQKRSKSTSI